MISNLWVVCPCDNSMPWLWSQVSFCPSLSTPRWSMGLLPLTQYPPPHFVAKHLAFFQQLLVAQMPPQQEISLFLAPSQDRGEDSRHDFCWDIFVTYSWACAGPDMCRVHQESKARVQWDRFFLVGGPTGQMLLTPPQLTVLLRREALTPPLPRQIRGRPWHVPRT